MTRTTFPKGTDAIYAAYEERRTMFSFMVNAQDSELADSIIRTLGYKHDTEEAANGKLVTYYFFSADDCRIAQRNVLRNIKLNRN